MAATYLDIKSIHYLISTIEPDSLEGPVQSTWTNLLGKAIFTEDEFAIETNRERNTQVPDVVVIEVKDFIGGPSGVSVLVVECKKPRSALTQYDFDQIANAQLGDQLTETVNSNSHVFGAVAIGKGVKFYIKHDREPHAMPIHSGFFDIVADSQLVMYWLGYIKENRPLR